MKKLLGLMMILVLVFALAGCGGGGEAAESGTDAEYVQGNGVMKIGYTVYEPMNYTDDEGVFTGFDTELATAVCEKIGVEPEFIEINWDTKTVELEAKNIDCIWNGMTITEELLANITISDPYAKNSQVMIKKRGTQSKIKATEDVIGKTVVAEAGSAGEKAIQADENLSQAELVTVTKQTDALVEVQAGTADVAVIDLTMAKATIGEGTDFEELNLIDGVELSLEEYGVGFRKDSDLAELVNNAFAELVADGTIADLAEKYGVVLADAMQK